VSEKRIAEVFAEDDTNLKVIAGGRWHSKEKKGAKKLAEIVAPPPEPYIPKATISPCQIEIPHLEIKKRRKGYPTIEE